MMTTGTLHGARSTNLPTQTGWSKAVTNLVDAGTFDTLAKVSLGLLVANVGVRLVDRYVLQVAVKTPRGTLRVPRTDATMNARSLYHLAVGCGSPNLLSLAVGVDVSHAAATDILHDAVQREHERGPHRGVWTTRGIAMGQTLEHGPKISDAQTTALALGALDDARDERGVVIVGESHGSSSAYVFRSHLNVKAQQGEVVLLEGWCDSDRLNPNQIASHNADGARLKSVRGLEKPQILAMHCVLECLYQLRTQRHIDEQIVRATLSQVAHLKRKNVFTNALGDMAHQDKERLRPFVEDVCAGQFGSLTMPMGPQNTTLLASYFTAIAKLLPRTDLDSTALDAFDKYVDTGRDDAFADARSALILVRDVCFANAIYRAEKQFAGCQISAVVGMGHAVRTHFFLERLRKNDAPKTKHH